jgi:hypothetical protein
VTMSIKYRPLRDCTKDIRLLELQPPTDGAGTLQANLVHAPLESAIYTALSYVW